MVMLLILGFVAFKIGIIVLAVKALFGSVGAEAKAEEQRLNEEAAAQQDLPEDGWFAQEQQATPHGGYYNTPAPTTPGRQTWY